MQGIRPWPGDRCARHAACSRCPFRISIRNAFTTPNPFARRTSMRRISYSLAFAIVGAGLLCAAFAFADPKTCPGFTPTPTSAALFLREFNDCPSSTLSSINGYPALIQIDDLNVDCIGGANLHSWNFSTDGLTTVTFENCSVYRYCADVMLNSTGAGGGEGGLKVSPWWNAPHYAVDGRFMINAGSGEIACFGGRLPFFSFTSTY